MERFREIPQQAYQSLDKDKPEDILSRFTLEQQAEIKYKQQILSSLAYFIGKDFRIPVELNEPGQGWHWDFKDNKIRIDPQDLLDKSMDYLRFVISHEGGHRRISRTEFIPAEEWQQPGFSFMMNAIEDPRDNNFVAESYPKFRDQMALAYQQDLDFEAKAKGKAAEKLGYQPRFMRAGFEYIRQWYREAQGQDFQFSEDLPQEVREAVYVTLEAARDSWWRYPSRQEADSGEEIISKYAKASYEINRDRIWPEFKKLVEQDLQDQKLQELFKQGLPRELQDKLPSGEETKPLDLDSLPEEMKQKIQDYLDSLPDEKKADLAGEARRALKEFEDALNEELQGKLSENPGQRDERKESDAETTKPEAEQIPEPPAPRPALSEQELKQYRQRLEKELKKDANIYEQMRREVLPLIDKLESDLREIFVARRAKTWKTGFKSGKRINIKKRIQEKAKDIPAVESRAWQKREFPQEKDYAITLLNDLSGSMARGGKIQEDFKAKIVISEVLNRLSVNTEILGFNDRIYEYQKFGESMSANIREKMGSMLKEVHDTSDTGKAQYNDDGWALEQASARLARQKADHKFLIVLSDGRPEESPMHPRAKYELGKIVKQVLEQTDQKLVGLGIGRGTEHVSRYYPNSLANVNIKEMAEKLAALIKEVIAHYDSF